MRKMNVERQHKCPTCDRGFGSKRALGDHRRDRHHLSQPLSEVPAAGPRQPDRVLHVGRLKGPSTGKRRLGFPGALVASTAGVQLPELTHKLSVEDRLFIDNYLNPCDERMGPSSGSKIPDGSLPNSGVNGFREVINVAPPFPLPNEPGAIGGPLWSLIILKLPVIREAIYLIATNTRDDLSTQDQVDIANAYNSGRFPIFPTWGNVVEGNSNLKVSRVVWSQLRSVTNLSTLFKQVRISKSGYTTFHNTPDLYNQGMVITAQWNLDNSPRGLTTSTTEEPVVARPQYSFTWTVNSGASLVNGFAQTPTMIVPLVPDGVPSGVKPIASVVVPISIIGVSGKISFVGGEGIPLEVGGLLSFEVTNPGQSLLVNVKTVDALGQEHKITRQISPISSGSVQLVWEVVSLKGMVAGTEIELPPLDTQTIVQSTPKAVVLPMKQFNGAYSVLRAWEPVFELQESDNLGPIQWSRKSGLNLSGLADRDPDLVDLNFGTSVQAIMGISLAASVTIKIIQDIEFVAGDDSPWQGFMNPNVNVDPQVIALARAISLEQPFAFPQTYNSMGTLLDGVESLLSRIPIIGNAVPLVSKVVRSFFPSSGPDNSPAPEVRAGDISQLITQLVQALGLGK